MAGVAEHHEPARSRTGDDSLLPGLCRTIPYRVYLPSPRWASPHTHPCRAVGCSHGGTSCPSRRCAHPAVAVAWVCARGVVRHGHNTTSGFDALTVTPVRPPGLHRRPCRRTPQAADGPQEGHGTVRPRAGLGRWRACGDRLPSPGALARRLRPRPAARGPAPQLQPDSQRPPGAPGRAREGAS